MTKKNNFPHGIEKQQEQVYTGVIARIYRAAIQKIKSGIENFAEFEGKMLDETLRIYASFEFLSRQFDTINNILDSWAYSHTKLTLKKAMLRNRNKFTTIDFLKEDPIINDFKLAYKQSNIQLVQALGKEYIPNVTELASKTFLQGGSIKDLIPQLMAYTNGERDKAAFWARDQLGDAYSDFTKVRQQSIGIQEYFWRTVKDNHVRGSNITDKTSHIELEGMRFTWAKGAIETGQISKPGARHPGQDYNCVPTGSKIFFDSDIIRCYRRRFNGELTEIITGTDKTIRCTPNHPILTTSGWKAAKDIDFSDNLVQISDKLVDSCKQNITNRIFFADKIFDFFSLTNPIERVTGFTSQFHGDGTDEEIDVITTDRGLMDKGNFSYFKSLKKIILSVSNKMWIFCLRFPGGNFHFKRFSFLPASRGLMGFFCKSLFFFIRKFFHPYKISFRSISRNDTMIKQPGTDPCSGNRILSGTGEFAHSVPVIFDKRLLVNNFVIVRPTSLNKFHYDGYLYNFETEDNIYYVDHMSSHNCRCTAEGVIE